MKNGIKDALDRVYGVDIADTIMDYALYSILFHSDVTSAFASRMHNELLYSKEARSDSCSSDLLEHKMTEAQGLLLKKPGYPNARRPGTKTYGSA